MAVSNCRHACFHIYRETPEGKFVHAISIVIIDTKMSSFHICYCDLIASYNDNISFLKLNLQMGWSWVIVYHNCLVNGVMKLNTQ